MALKTSKFGIVQSLHNFIPIVKLMVMSCNFDDYMHCRLCFTLVHINIVWYTHTIELNQHDKGRRIYEVVKMKPTQPSYSHSGTKNDKIEFTCGVNLQWCLEERDNVDHDLGINILLFLWVGTCYTPFIMCQEGDSSMFSMYNSYWLLLCIEPMKKRRNNPSIL